MSPPGSKAHTKNAPTFPVKRHVFGLVIRYSELMALIGELAVAGKTLNNYLIPLRGVFAFAKRDGAIAHDPASEIENAAVQRPAPDPFTLPEAEAILGQLGAREDAQVVNYFTAAFFGGFRPSEQIALRWTDVDFQQRTVRVQRAVVRGQAKASTMTYLVRDVELSDRAWAAIEAQRARARSSPEGKSSGIPRPGSPGPTSSRNGASGSAA